MIYQVQMQFIPGSNIIWVAKLNPEDPIYEYDNYDEAAAKSEELKAADTSGRDYRVFSIS
jgi:hypothetical protein